jgi:hypothetical protein
MPSTMCCAVTLTTQLINDNKNTYTTIHYGGTDKHEMQSCGYAASSGSFGGAYHVHAVEWAPWGQIKL